MNIALFALEKSADLYGAKIARHLKTMMPDVVLTGVGGDLLLQEGQHPFMHMSSFQVMGFSDVFKKIFPLMKHFYHIRDALLKKNPDLILCIDSPAFSLRLAKALRKKGYTGKIVQFVAPTVWAHGKSRSEDIAKYFDLLLTVYDFEEVYFPNVQTLFVGHPIVEIIEEASKKREMLSFSKKVLALFPGSRPGEIARNLPLQIEAARLFLQKNPDFEVAIGCATRLQETGIEATYVCFEDRFELMKKADLALAKCGTVTLELAYHNLATVVMYELSLLNRFMAQYVLKIDKMPFYAMPNILCNRALFTECIKEKPTPEILCHTLCDTLQKKPDFSQFRKRLVTDESPTKRVAKALCERLS